MDRRYPERPLVGVGVVVWRAGSVLLVRRANPPRQGEWSLPGGLQRLGETVADAARREVAEETGLDVRIVGTVDVVDLIESDPADGRVVYHYTLVDVAALWAGGEATPGGDAAEVAWADAGALGAYALWSETERVVALSRRAVDAVR